VAIGGEFETRENGSNKPNPLPSLAASCAHNEMVRRGRRFESVRGLCKRPARRPLIAQIQLLLFQRGVGMEPLVELSSSERPGDRRWRSHMRRFRLRF